MSDWQIVESNDAISFSVRVAPRSSRNVIAGVEGTTLKIKLTAPPVEGAANAALIEFVAAWLGVRKTAVSIVSGSKARNKVMRVDGITAQHLLDRLKTDRS